jgi:hypothetical protein
MEWFQRKDWVAGARTVIPRLGKWFIIGGVFCALTLITFEVAARQLFPHQAATWRWPLWSDQPHVREIYFLTQGGLHNAANYGTYKPNSKIRLLAYFPDASGALTLEYDCAFPIDERGFISNGTDYKDSEILVFGDSFTMGAGGCYWLSRLDPDVKMKLYTAVHPGTGVSTWRAILADLEKTKKPTKILFIMISDDLARSNRKYTEATLDCLNLLRNCDDQIIIPITSKIQEVIAARSQHYRPVDLKTTLKYYLPASFELLRRIRHREWAPDDGIVTESVATIKEIASKYDLRLLWVTEKTESSGPSPFTETVTSRLPGIHISKCQIPATGFMPRDYHPNSKGYDILKGCVEKLVRSW